MSGIRAHGTAVLDCIQIKAIPQELQRNLSTHKSFPCLLKISKEPRSEKQFLWTNRVFPWPCQSKPALGTHLPVPTCPAQGRDTEIRDRDGKGAALLCRLFCNGGWYRSGWENRAAGCRTTQGCVEEKKKEKFWDGLDTGQGKIRVFPKGAAMNPNCSSLKRTTHISK